jgi:predicted outer membrane repeat protein
MSGQQKYKTIPNAPNSRATHPASFGGGAIACEDGSIHMHDARIGCCEMISPPQDNGYALCGSQETAKEVTLL